MKTDCILIDFVGATSHFTKQLFFTLNNETFNQVKLITIKSKISNKASSFSAFRNKIFRLSLIPINYFILFTKVVRCSPNNIFIFNIPLIPILELFFLFLIRMRGGISVGILHNLVPFHGEKKLIRNYKYLEFYSYCDIVTFHDASIIEIFNEKFPKSTPLLIDLPSYLIPDSASYYSKEFCDSKLLKLGFMGTIRPYKNLEIVALELEKLNPRQLSSISLSITGKAFYDIDKLVLRFENLALGEFIYNKEPLDDNDFYKQMARCNFLLLPHINSSGSALLSVAAALGVPIIASNLNVFTDFVHRFGNGVIFNHLVPGDLQRIISILLEDKVQQQELKKCAMNAIKSIPNWRNYVNEIIVCCDALAKRRAG